MAIPILKSNYSLSIKMLLHILAAKTIKYAHINPTNLDFAFQLMRFSFSVPTFDLFFSGNGGLRITGHFIVNQSFYIILRSKTTFIQMIPMLLHPTNKIVCNTGIKNSPITVCQNVDIIVHLRYLVLLKMGILPRQAGHSGYFLGYPRGP